MEIASPKSFFSAYLSKKLNYDYVYLSNIFLEVKGIYISQFIIGLKIEKAKELLMYHEMKLTDISLSLNYSSASHLSRQLKKVTGLSPACFKKLKLKRHQHENL